MRRSFKVKRGTGIQQRPSLVGTTAPGVVHLRRTSDSSSENRSFSIRVVRTTFIGLCIRPRHALDKEEVIPREVPPCQQEHPDEVVVPGTTGKRRNPQSLNERTAVRSARVVKENRLALD